MPSAFLTSSCAHCVVEELVRSPLRILEPLVARRRLDRGLGVLFAGHAAHRATEQIEIGLAHLGLQVLRARLVREPVFGDHAERLDDLADFVRRLVLGLAVLARLEIGRQRLAAALHRPRDVHRECFGVKIFRRLGFGANIDHGGDTITSFRVRHRADRR